MNVHITLKKKKKSQEINGMYKLTLIFLNSV